MQSPAPIAGRSVFIGHGRSLVWRELKDFISDRLGLPWDEFNRVPVAGVGNVARLSEMMNHAGIAFLVLTAEDETADGKERARQNVVHEAGLFQGRLGFARAIVVLEEGCEEFSNIHGLGQIRFPRGRIDGAFEEVRRCLSERGSSIPDADRLRLQRPLRRPPLRAPLLPPAIAGPPAPKRSMLLCRRWSSSKPQKRFREKVEKRVRAAETSPRELRELGVDSGIELPDIDDAATQYVTELRRLLAESKVRVPEPPDLGLMDIAKRAIARTRPFSESGSGYQDTLIWLQVIEEARDDDVVFLTRDQGFTDGGGNLAADLVADLETAGIAPERVRLSSKTTNAVHDHLGPSITAVTHARAAVDDPGFRSRLLDAVAEQVLYSQIRVPREDEELRSLDVEDGEVDSLESLEEVEIDDAQELENGNIAFNFGGVASADITIYPLKSEAYGAELDEVVVEDWDWNEWVVRASKTIELSVEGQAELNPEHNELVDAHLWLVY
jgi:Predicted nucleotide-binding protein containing TIR-like domain/PIN domain